MNATSINSARDRRWLILGVIGLAQLMVILDLTVMNIALPSTQRALHFTTVDRQWLFAGGAVVGGVLLRRGPLDQKRTASPAHGGVRELVAHLAEWYGSRRLTPGSAGCGGTGPSLP